MGSQSVASVVISTSFDGAVRYTIVAALSEHHEVRVRGRGQTVVFVGDSDDGRLIIRQETEGKKPKEVCSITLSDPDELRAFFKGLRRLMASLEYVGPRPSAAAGGGGPTHGVLPAVRGEGKPAVAPWTKEEENEICKRYESGETIQSIAGARKRSPRSIELRLQRLGVLPPDQP